jgi:hypothetical protein
MVRLMDGLKEAQETTKRKRVQKEAPFEELRHAFIVGRPTEVDHTPLSAVNAAQAELIRLELAIKERGLTCAAQVALVVGSKDQQPFGGKLFVVSRSLEEIATMITAISQLKEPTLAGLVYCVMDTQTGAYEFWTKAFIKGRDAEKTLDLAVADGLKRLQNKPGPYSA